MTSEISSKKRSKGDIIIIGAGYIGNSLKKYLDTQYNVSLYASKDLDYSDTLKFSKLILNTGAGYVINCSGFTGRPNVDEGEIKKELCWKLNVINPLNIAKICEKFGVKYIHISSGCIYNGYSKIFKEEDSPNFGIFDDSSFYSKSKHAFETLTASMDFIKILRLRMPICDDLENPRNYLKKIMGYPNLIDARNSKTYVPDLCGFVDNLIQSDVSWLGQDIYNVVNHSPMSTFDIIQTLNANNDGNWDELTPSWVSLQELNTAAPRSNCVLDNTKASKIYNFRTEKECLNVVMANNKIS